MHDVSTMRLRCLVALGAIALLAASPTVGHTQSNGIRPLPYTGVNLAGGEFYEPEKTPNPVEGKNYTYPTPQEFDYFASKGMNVFRVPFRWETLQPREKQPLSGAAVSRLKAVVKSATDRGLTIILDPHNSDRFDGRIAGPGVLADFWGRMAGAFRGNSHVWFSLTNEPHDMPTEQWLGDANAAIAAIRKAGARNRILVPGNAYTGAHSWYDTYYGTPNANVMQDVHDPIDNYVYDAHQYLDGDNSGTTPQVISPTIGSERLKLFVKWCRQHKKRAFLGEFAAANSPIGRQAIEDMARSMERDRDVWVGYCWWAAGAWWHDYMFSLEPLNGRDKPQMGWLRPHLQKRAR